MDYDYDDDAWIEYCQMVKGFAYVLEFENGVIKIGMSKSEARHKTIERMSASPITRFFYKPTEDCRGLERKAHDFFKECRLRYEFFDVPFESAVKFLKRAR